MTTRTMLFITALLALLFVVLFVTPGVWRYEYYPSSGYEGMPRMADRLRHVVYERVDNNDGTLPYWRRL